MGDSKDGTLAVLQEEVKRLQAPSSPFRFHSAAIIEKDFGDDLSQSVEERHSFKAQGTRRKSIGRARNYLLYAALRPEHRWVYWRDVDIVEHPATVIEDLMKHDRDIIVPSERLMRLSIAPFVADLEIQTFGSTGSVKMAKTSRADVSLRFGS